MEISCSICLLFLIIVPSGAFFSPFQSYASLSRSLGSRAMKFGHQSRAADSSSLKAVKYQPLGDADGDKEARKEMRRNAALAQVASPGTQDLNILEPTFEDMKQMAFILSNVTEHLDTQPELALSVASANIGWLLQRQVPKLTQMLLTEYPALRQDNGMMRAYLFLLDFLEAMAKETGNMIEINQKALRLLLEAAKGSENALDECIGANSELVTSQEFMVYLDTEIENQAENSQMENVLITLKLRILDEVGKGLGVDVTVLPKLASIADPVELKQQTVNHLKSYTSVGGKQLFLQALGIMRKEMTKRYDKVDPSLFSNLEEIEKICRGIIKLQLDSESKDLR